MSEIWKDIPGYEGRYQASTEGRIRSVDREIKARSRYGNPHSRHYFGRVLRPGRMPSGHMSVVLGHGQPGSTVHALVMLTFVGPPPEGKEVCHNDGNPANNRLDNLRYDTRGENIIDDLKRGTRSKAKFRAEDVRRIKRLLVEGKTGAAIARQFGVKPRLISDIKMGRTYAWVK